MHQVEVVVGVWPWYRLCVVQLKLHIRRHPCGLDWRYISTYHFGAWIFVGEIPTSTINKSAGKDAQERELTLPIFQYQSQRRGPFADWS